MMPHVKPERLAVGDEFWAWGAWGAMYGIQDAPSLFSDEIYFRATGQLQPVSRGNLGRAIAHVRRVNEYRKGRKGGKRGRRGREGGRRGEKGKEKGEGFSQKGRRQKGKICEANFEKASQLSPATSLLRKSTSLSPLRSMHEFRFSAPLLTPM
jgi:hypothetical protein